MVDGTIRSLKTSDFRNLLLAQSSAPLARIAFAALLLPVHPEGSRALQILALSEILSCFLTLGRNYLIQGGYRHHLLNRSAEKLVMILLSAGAYTLFSTEEQRSLASGVVVVTVAVSAMSMLNASFLRDRHLLAIAPLNFAVYALVASAPYMPPTAAIIAVLAWLLIEHKLPVKGEVPRNRFLPSAAALIAFASQRIDVQIAAILGNTEFLNEVFQLNVMFMPLALGVRLVSNTALLRGASALAENQGAQPVLAAFGLSYSLLLYGVGATLGNGLITENFSLLVTAVILSAVTVSYRERISVASQHGNFLPAFILALIGVSPSVLYLSAFGDHQPVSEKTFIGTLYLAPRLLMFLFGLQYSKKVARA